MANEEEVTPVTTPKPRAPRARKKPEPKPTVEITPTEIVVVEEVVVEEVSEKPEAKEEHGGIDELRQLFDEVDEEPEPEPVIPPLSVRGTILAPGYWQAFDGELGRVNVLAFLGFIASFTFFPLGILLSGLGLLNAKAVPRDTVGRIFGWAGLVISTFITVAVFFWILLLPFTLAFHGNY